MNKLKDGLNKCSNLDYHADTEYISSSNYKTLLTDVGKFHKEKILGIREEQEEKSYFVEGSYVHSLILEPELLDEEYAIFPGKRKAGKEYEDFKEKHSDKQILSIVQKERCERFLEAYKGLEARLNLIQRGESEHTVCGTLNGIKTKVRCDYININESYIVDVKTSSMPVDQESFKETVEKYKYDLSATLYLNMVEQYYGKSFDFYFACIDKKNLTCELFKLSKESRAKGQSYINKAVLIYKKCLSTDNWNGNINIEYDILEV